MKRPSNDPDVERLIAVCLELYETDGPRAVDAVLRKHPDSSRLVRERLDLLGRMGLVGEPPADALPERIGSYEIVGILGRGGMGVVYEARQEAPRRPVALKVLRTMPGDGTRGRLEHEAELLARLQHPGIAHVYEVGTATVGGMTVPFFAMELVRGTPVDLYAREAGLDARERLALLAKIADAVHHAHQKGTVHRDLKPANILVDERGEPRVLDFGIARAIDPDLELETARTEVGQLVGTLAYMSPEQAGGDPVEIDSRTDVYSLGVVAYELLAGGLPRPVEGKTVLHLLQSIRDDDAPLLSTTRPGLRGDVETIVAKALEREKERRYSSAHELAADVRRYLNDEPIGARPATATYQLAKFARRHRALVGGAIALVLALALGLAGTLTGMVRAARERDDAERRFRQANAVLAFQKRMFASADPEQQGIQVEDLLDRATLLVEDESDGEVDRAALLFMLGEAYEGLGEYTKAEPLLAEAAGIFERQLGPEDLQTLTARIRLATLYARALVQLDDAERALAGVAETAARVHGAAHDVTVSAHLTRATIEIERGRHAEAVRIDREVLELLDPEHSQWISAKKHLAKSLRRLGEPDEGIAIAREVYEHVLAKHGKAHPATWDAMDTLGNALQLEGHIKEGTTMVDELLALRTQHLGPSHPDTLNAMVNAGAGHLRRADYNRAEELTLQALGWIEQRFPEGHPERLVTLNTLATAYVLQGRAKEAEPIFRTVLEGTAELRGAEHDDTLTTANGLAMTLEKLGELDEAEGLYRDTLQVRRRVHGDDDAETLTVLYNLGSFYLRHGRYDDADAYLREAVETARRALGPDNFLLGQFLCGFGSNLVYLGRYQEAEDVLLEARERMDRTFPGADEHPWYVWVLRHLERLYRTWGRPEDAAVYATLLEERG